MNIPFKSTLSRFKNIKNRNKAFNELSDIEKRREIAYDALMLIINCGIRGSSGHYWNSKLLRIVDKSENNKDLQNNLITIFQEKFSCSVCQRGLLMISRIRLGNSVGPSDEFDRGDVRTLNKSGFDIESFEALEKEYEIGTWSTPYTNHSTEKLANLCCNIIENGDFDTDDKTDYLTHWSIQI